MKGSFGYYIKKILLSLLILLVLTISVNSQDRRIGGVVNSYKRVVAIGPGTDNITLNDVTSIAPGDIVLLIQMKGAIISIPESGSYGSYKDFVGAPGLYEFLIVQSVNSGTKVVVFTNPILKSYNVDGLVQLVRVPFYNSAIVTSTLSCEPWDSISKTGGVLTMIVGKTLSLNANIDVTGKGFYGGAIAPGQGICLETNSVLYDKFSYPDILPTNSGLKGESQVSRAFIDNLNKPPVYPAYARGKGNNFTGGGGSNGRFSGGGGGSNYGTGGKGGREIASCVPTPGDGGLGGRQVKFTDLDGGIFLGSGGGSSTYESTPTASPGARGGGIIIILCDTLKGKGRIIKAEGDTPGTTATGNAGAGGGGGGGSIALYMQSYSTKIDSSALTISANGGKGGNNAGSFGEGGGGGGGLILTNNIAIPGNVTKTVTGGAVGNRSGGSTGGAGTTGESLLTYTPVLNGFLFNSIRSSVTGNQIDSICSNVPFGTISGTQPVGGVPPYTIIWEASTVSESSGYVPASGINNTRDYTPGLLTQTTWFRRIVTDFGPPVTTDISKAVKVIVQQAITGNIVGKDTVICRNQNPLPLIPLNAGPSNGSSFNYYNYNWKQNNTNTNWSTSPAASGTSINAAYDPPALTATTYYQRVVTSGRCISYSPTVTVTVLPLITGNITTRPDSVICQGSLFGNLGASAPGGGDLVNYRYQWQDSINASVWTPASGTNTSAVYTPDTSAFSVVEKHYLRRVVYSGPDDVCRSRSVPILLTRYHKIRNNIILSDQTICSASTPAPLSGSVPINGSGIYTYTWQDSTKTGHWTSRATTDFSFSPPALTDTTWYRRKVNSSKCANTSLPLRINVHKPVVNNISLLSGGFDTTICSGAIPHRLKGLVATGGTGIPGSYTYQWVYSTDNVTFPDVPSAGTGVSYLPQALTTPATYYYKRKVSSGACINIISGNAIKVNVLPPVINTIPADKEVCINTTSSPITGLNLSGGRSGQYKFRWESSPDGISNWNYVTADTITTPSGADIQLPLLATPIKYRRRVWSGPYNTCSSISNIVNVSVTAKPYPVYAGKDTILSSFEYVYRLQATKPILGTGAWSLLSSQGSPVFDDTLIYNTVVRSLSSGLNTFKWKVKNGVCVMDASVNITIVSLEVPQGISPNGDGYNDILDINGLDFSTDDQNGKPNQIIELTIINSAGSQVYFTSNANGHQWRFWDGKTNDGGDLSEGTYYYLLKIISNRTSAFIKKSGFIILKRY
jgi:hypothetical protein